MFTNKDIEYRSIFVVNSIENKTLRVLSGELLLEDTKEKKTLTKLPFQKILAVFVIGHATITTPLIEKCTRNGTPIVVMKPNMRPVFFFSVTAESNFLLRKRQYLFEKTDITIAKILIINKIVNQISLLNKARLKNKTVQDAKHQLNQIIENINKSTTAEQLRGLEGRAAKTFFSSYYETLGWSQRLPRTKIDPLNATLDIGYTLLFNFIECFVRLFGFDPYYGVYHRLWFKRKSLICDLIEPFRCIIDHRVRIAFNNNQFKKSDFKLIKNEYILKPDKNPFYNKVFFESIIEYKSDIFIYIRNYYKCFMRNANPEEYPKFSF